VYSDTHIQHHGTLIVFQISTDTVFLPNSQGSVKVDYKLELDTVSTTEALKKEMVEYVDDHSGFVSELQINPNSITYDG
jgi:hypothetical protein